MDKMDDLRRRIEARLQCKNFEDNGEEISLQTLQEVLNTAMKDYNKLFVDCSKELAKTMNNKTFVNRLFKGEVPIIASINPTIEEDNSYYLEVLFTNREGKYEGDAIIDKNFNIDILFLKDYYSEEKTIALLKKFSVSYIYYFEQMLNFTLNYPNSKCSWGNDSQVMNEKIDDGFLTAHFYLDRLDSTALSFSNIEDTTLGITKTRKYGELYDYIEFYKGKIMRSTSVNINDLSDLYQKIVRKQLKLENNATLKMSNLYKHML